MVAPPTQARLEAQLQAARAALSESECIRQQLMQKLAAAQQPTTTTETDLRFRLARVEAELRLMTERAEAAEADAAILRDEVQGAQRVLLRQDEALTSLLAKQPRESAPPTAPASPTPPATAPYRCSRAPSTAKSTAAQRSGAEASADARTQRALQSALRRAALAEGSSRSATKALHEAESRAASAEATSSALSQRLQKAEGLRSEATSASESAHRLQDEAVRMQAEWRALARHAQDEATALRTEVQAERSARDRLAASLLGAQERLELQSAELVERRQLTRQLQAQLARGLHGLS